MQPQGWGTSVGGGRPPPGWGGPAAGHAPSPGWGDHAPGFGNPPPTWGSAAGPGRTPLDDADEPRGIGGTIAAHVVLWGGLLLVASTARFLLEPLLRSGAPVSVTYSVTAVYQLLPVAAALVLAGRSAGLRVLGLLAGLLLILTDVFLVLVPGNPGVGWMSRVAAFAFGLGVWMIVRRHARVGYALLAVLGLLLLLWYPTWGPAPEIAQFPVRHGVYSIFVNSVWDVLPLVAAGGIGLASSFLRPRPTRGGDAVGWAVAGGLAVLLVLALVATSIGSPTRF